MSNNKCPVSCNSDIVLQNLEKELLIYNLKTNKAFCLNETSSMVFEMCDGKTSISEIANKISSQVKKPVSNEFVWLALWQMKQHGLLENWEEIQNEFNGLTRRDIVKRVGFSSLIVLPLISSVVAPSAIHAQSALLAIGAICTNNSDCNSNYCVNAASGPVGPFCCVPGTDGLAANERFGSCAPVGTCATDQFNCCSNSSREVPNGVCPVGTIDCLCN